jgi:hypothetical protein
VEENDTQASAQQQPETEKLTAEALQDHNLFLKEATAKRLGSDEFEEALGKLPPTQLQCLWKKFENSRKREGVDGDYKQMTSSSASSGQTFKRKRELLRSWVLDSGKPAKHYKQASQSFKVAATSEVSGSWLTKKQALDTWGVEELKSRLQAGTIQSRKNKADSRFWEFRMLTETDAVKTTKEKASTVKSRKDATVEDVLAWNALGDESLFSEDFDLEAAAGESSSSGLDKDLAKYMGFEESKAKVDKKEKTNALEKASVVTDQDSSQMVEKKIVSFKGEVAKEIAQLENLQATLKHSGLEDKQKKELAKTIVLKLKAAEASKTRLAGLLSKKPKLEQVKNGLAEAVDFLSGSKKLKADVTKKLKAT